MKILADRDAYALIERKVGFIEIMGTPSDGYGVESDDKSCEPTLCSSCKDRLRHFGILWPKKSKELGIRVIRDERLRFKGARQ